MLKLNILKKKVKIKDKGKKNEDKTTNYVTKFLSSLVGITGVVK